MQKRETGRHARNEIILLTHAPGVLMVRPSITTFDLEEFPNSSLLLQMRLRSNFKHFRITRPSFCQQKIVAWG